jgi:putative ABC transport system permease protein
MQSLLRNLRFGARMLSNSPGFTLATIITLALGIAANTAIFTVTSALLRPLPCHDPQQLVSVSVKDKAKDFDSTLLRYELVRDLNQSFQSVAVWTNDNLNLTRGAEPLQVPVARVSPSFFSLLGVQPQLGRTFTGEEGSPQGKPVVMLSDAIWRSRFHGDPNIIGQTVTLHSTSHAIVGVLPANVQFPFVALGLSAALLLTRLVSSMLYQVGTRDLTTFVLTPLMFLSFALLASDLPALRATRVDPMEALR